jgi:hypothetical protein
VTIPNPRGRGEFSNNLHAYWDDLLGTDEDPATVEKLVDCLMQEHSRSEFTEEVGKKNIRQWAEESVGICLRTVYINLDPNITRFTDRPVGYEADSLKVARRRVTLAGYRLADELKRQIGQE